MAGHRPWRELKRKEGPLPDPREQEVEAAAEAMARYDGDNCFVDDDLNEPDAGRREHYRDYARAALAASRSQEQPEVRSSEGYVGPVDREDEPHVWIRYENTDGGWFICGDEGGEFARANEIDAILPYVENLLYGPGTLRQWKARAAAPVATEGQEDGYEVYRRSGKRYPTREQQAQMERQEGQDA